jgi:hypothetical protein
MKTLILSSVSAAALLFASAAFADGNSSTITQIGTSQNATVDQTQSSGGSVAQITQGQVDGDANNVASVTQGGANNQASVTQGQGAYGLTNPSNSATTDQEGTGGAVTVIQLGNNSVTVQQLAGSSAETALVGQSNNFNSAAIVQQGARELAVVNQQTGSGNIASITQNGTGDGETAGHADHVYGTGNLYRNENVPSDSVLPGAAEGKTSYGPSGAYVDQAGFSNQGTVNQQGMDNFADVAQGAPDDSTGNIGTVTQGAGLDHTDGLIYQQGDTNIAAVNQSGSGSSYSTIWQNGVSNQAYSTQSGSENSVIAQGQTGAGQEPLTIPTPGAPVSNDYASVFQSGGNDASLVNQTGSNNSAYVSQQAANATSTVTQGGSFNVATVRQ